MEFFTTFLKKMINYTLKIFRSLYEDFKIEKFLSNKKNFIKGIK